MSSVVSTVTTIKCDAFECGQERIDVSGSIGASNLASKQGWGEIMLNSNEHDVCPKHLAVIETLLFGPDDDHAENNADGAFPFEVKEECI
jgi:hypothetical protein